MRTWKTLILSVSIIFSGCFRVPKIDWSNPTETQSRVKIENDDFQKITNYRGPAVQRLDQGHYDRVFIRAWKSQKDSDTLYQIYASDTYSDFYTGGWKYLSEAYDSDGKKLDLTKIDKDVSCSKYGCKHTEDIALNVSRKYLEQHEVSGISFQISGTAGKEVFSLPGGYIKGFLAVVPK
jgi:hypothetical protein